MRFDSVIDSGVFFTLILSETPLALLFVNCQFDEVKLYKRRHYRTAMVERGSLVCVSLVTAI